MQFAYSHCSDTLREVIQRAHATDVAAGKQWLALLDGSMLNAARLDALEKSFAINASTVLDGTPLENFGRQGPLLIPIPPLSSAAIEALTRLCNAIPALSFVVPRQEGSARTKQALSWLALANTDDGTELHCRFADTRVTPHLLDVLTAEQFAGLSSVIECWYWPDRQGRALDSRLFVQRAKHSVDSLPFNQPFALDAAQFAQMLRAAEADMVFQMLSERMPDLRPSYSAGETHARIERMLVAAHARGLEDLPDLFQWVVIGLSTYDSFDQDPALAPVWQKHDPQSQRFGDWAQQWPEQVWQALGSAELTQA